MLKIAILADLHLTDNSGSVKLKVLDWALEEARRRDAGLLVGIGDLTATGSAVQAELLFGRVAACGIPFCATPGNAECRESPDGAERQNIPSPGGVPLFLADSSADRLGEETLLRLGDLPGNGGFLLATHCPPSMWPESQRAVLDAAIARRAVTAVIAGHVHSDGPDTLRGLDPDKAAGGPPMMSIFTRSGDGNWSREDIVMPGVDPMDWTEAERAAFRRVLGVSCMYDPFGVLAEAAELKIPVAELRYGTTGGNTDISASLERWRNRGGRILSMHLPSLTGKEDSRRILEDAVRNAIALGCDRVTLHVPEIRAGEYPALKTRLADDCSRLIAPLLERGIRVGIENLHTINGKCAPEERVFGCTIPECADWIAALRDRTGSVGIGFHLDIGHARNNSPFSQTMNVSDYYNAPGLPVNGLHFHQVRQQPDGTFKNHAPLEEFYGKLIALGGYFLARRAGLLAPEAPVILEIQQPGGGIASYRKLTGHL